MIQMRLEIANVTRVTEGISYPYISNINLFLKCNTLCMCQHVVAIHKQAGDEKKWNHSIHSFWAMKSEIIFLPLFLGSESEIKTPQGQNSEVKEHRLWELVCEIQRSWGKNSKVTGGGQGCRPPILCFFGLDHQNWKANQIRAVQPQSRGCGELVT